MMDHWTAETHKTMRAKVPPDHHFQILRTASISPKTMRAYNHLNEHR